MCTRVTDMQMQTLNVYSHIHVFSVPWTLRIYNSKKEHFIKNVYMEWYFNMHQTTFCSSFAYIRFPTLPCLVFPYGIIYDVDIYIPLPTDKDNKENKRITDAPTEAAVYKVKFVRLVLCALYHNKQILPESKQDRRRHVWNACEVVGLNSLTGILGLQALFLN